MEYNSRISMANIHNVVVALNAGGALTCNGLMQRIWDAATDAQRLRKVNAPRNTANHNVDFAKSQVRQEIRRSLYSYFNDPEALGLHIFCANPIGSAEVFWVVEEQTITTESDVEVITNPTPDQLNEAFHSNDDIVNASLIERLVSANKSNTPTSDLIRASVDNNRINPDMPRVVCDILNDAFTDFTGLVNDEHNQSLVQARINEIICSLEAAGE